MVTKHSRSLRLRRWDEAWPGALARYNRHGSESSLSWAVACTWRVQAAGSNRQLLCNLLLLGAAARAVEFLQTLKLLLCRTTPAAVTVQLQRSSRAASQPPRQQLTAAAVATQALQLRPWLRHRLLEDPLKDPVTAQVSSGTRILRFRCPAAVALSIKHLAVYLIVSVCACHCCQECSCHTSIVLRLTVLLELAVGAFKRGLQGLRSLQQGLPFHRMS